MIIEEGNVSRKINSFRVIVHIDNSEEVYCTHSEFEDYNEARKYILSCLENYKDVFKAEIIYD